MALPGLNDLRANESPEVLRAIRDVAKSSDTRLLDIQDTLKQILAEMREQTTALRRLRD